jgi:hypothetical protein
MPGKQINNSVHVVLKKAEHWVLHSAAVRSDHRYLLQKPGRVSNLYAKRKKEGGRHSKRTPSSMSEAHPFSGVDLPNHGQHGHTSYNDDTGDVLDP